MGRKKKLNLDFTPSEYQQKIFDFIQYGNGNASISACAGSGKTKVLTTAIKLISSNAKCIYLAFNKSIAEELSSRLNKYPNVDVRTSHSLGYLMLCKNIEHDIAIDEYKYKSYVRNNIFKLSSVQEQIKDKQQLNNYINIITSLIQFARYNYCQSIKEIKAIAAKYSIPILFDECDVVLKVLKWGKKHIKTIDFTDMIWLPVELNMKPMGLQYDWIMVDESQDQSIISIELIQKCFKRGSRAIFVGDKNQSIYAFSGSSEEAFNTLSSLPNTTQFNLPICYRCDNKIIHLAQSIVPEIQTNDNNAEGAILTNCFSSSFKENDLILSRAKAPLIKLYAKLLKQNIKCYIKGQNIASKLIDNLCSVDKQKLNITLNEDGVFLRLYENLFNNRNKLIQDYKLSFEDATLSPFIMEQYDDIKTLLTLSENCTTKNELISHIQNIFNTNEDGICLSTIHKAKGLESDNVYILCHSTMPSKLAKKDWEQQQEINLMYVAYTRAKHVLGFVSENEIKPCGSAQETKSILKELKLIENKICNILGIKPMSEVANIDIAKFNLKTITQIKHATKGKTRNIVINKPIDNTDLLKQLKSIL